MRKIIGAAHLSLDGVMQGPGGADEDKSNGFDLGGWSMNYADRKIGGDVILSLVGTLAEPKDLLLGRKTYDIFGGYWPNVASDNRIGPVFTRADKYVMTTSAVHLSWANSHRLSGIDDIRDIKSGDGRDIVIWGSSTLYPQLLDADLIDRLVLLTYPIALGKGKRLFGNTTHAVRMKLAKSEPTATGVIIATYDRAG